MKKSIFIPVIAGAVMLFSTSCKKVLDEIKKHDKDETVYKTVDLFLGANGKATYTLPVNTSENNFKITQQPVHYIVSQLGTDAFTGNITYEYTPPVNFTGDDVCVISTNDEKNVAWHGRTDCHDDDDGQNMIITINIHVTGSSTVVPVTSSR